MFISNNFYCFFFNYQIRILESGSFRLFLFAEVDWSARTDIALLLNSGYENISAQLMDLVNQCNNSLNAAITYCDSDW